MVLFYFFFFFYLTAATTQIKCHFESVYGLFILLNKNSKSAELNSFKNVT